MKTIGIWRNIQVIQIFERQIQWIDNSLKEDEK